MFIGYAWHTDGGYIGDLLIADREEFEQNVASDVHEKRLKYREGHIDICGGKVSVPCADGLIKQEGHVVPRPSRRRSCHLELQFPGNPQSKPMSEGHQTGERDQLYVLGEPSFPTPLKHIDVTRQTKHRWTILEESIIDDDWNVDGKHLLLGDWIGFTRFDILQKRPPKGHK